MAHTILIADDDLTVMKLLHLNVESDDLDLTIRSAMNGEEAIEHITREKPSVLILDIRMPKGDGFSVLEHLTKNNIDLPVVILTNYRNPEYVQKSKTYSCVKEYIVKHETRMDSVLERISGYLA